MDKNDRIIEYINNPRKSYFFPLFISSKKYKEYIRTEGKLSLILAIFITTIIYFIFTNSDGHSNFADFSKTTGTNIVVAMISLLGFIIGGLALLTGTININIIRNIDSEGKFKSLLSILYSFYFIGVNIGITILLFGLIYLVSHLNLAANIYIILGMSFVSSFFFSFSIIYSIALLGTCLNILFIAYKFSDEKTENTEK